MRRVLRSVIILATAALWVGAAADAQEELTRRDARGPVTVVVTLVAAPAVGVPVKAKVVLDTHSVGLDSIAFEKVVALRTSDGTDVAPMAVEEVSGSGHHRQAVLVFASLAAGPLRIIVKNVGGVAERSFVWELPAAR